MAFIVQVNEDQSEQIQYIFPDYPIYLRHSFLSDYPRYLVPSHWHRDVEWIVVLRGEMDYHINGQRVPLSEGQGVFVNAGQLHFATDRNQRECEFICLIFPPSLLCAAMETEYRFVLPITKNPHLPFLPLQPEVPWQSGIMEQVKDLLPMLQTPAAPLLIQGRMFAIWSLLYENATTEGTLLPHEGEDLATVKRMVLFLQEHHAEKLTLPQLAAAGAVGQSKCCKLFAHYFNRSPMVYLNEYRLNRSLMLLRTTDASMAEIAQTVGFGSGSYYTEQFHRWMGCTPSAWRKQTRQAGV